MARDALTVTPLAGEAGTASPTALTLVQDNGVEIDAKGDTARLLIWVNQTDATARVLTVKAPTDNPHAPRAALGDLAISCAQNVPRWILIESARFAQTTGKIHIDLAATFAGTMLAFRLPRGT
jgi:hypothetical protein